MQDPFRICLQICETKSIFLFSKMNQINEKSCPEIGRANKPLIVIVKKMFIASVPVDTGPFEPTGGKSFGSSNRRRLCSRSGHTDAPVAVGKRRTAVDSTNSLHS